MYFKVNHIVKWTDISQSERKGVNRHQLCETDEDHHHHHIVQKKSFVMRLVECSLFVSQSRLNSESHIWSDSTQFQSVNLCDLTIPFSVEISVALTVVQRWKNVNLFIWCATKYHCSKCARFAADSMGAIVEILMIVFAIHIRNI